MEEGGRGRCGGGRRGRGRGGGGGGGVSRLIVMMSISEEHLALSRPLKDIHYGAASPPPLIPLLLLSDPTDQPNIPSFFLPPPYSPFYSCLIFIFLFLTTWRNFYLIFFFFLNKLSAVFIFFLLNYIPLLLAHFCHLIFFLLFFSLCYFFSLSQLSCFLKEEGHLIDRRKELEKAGNQSTRIEDKEKR